VAYYVYHNWTGEKPDKLVLHEGSCPYCNEGRGIHPGAGANNGEWLGRYMSIHAANADVTRYGSSLRPCGHCAPA